MPVSKTPTKEGLRVGKILKAWRENAELPRPDLSVDIKRMVGPGHAVSHETLRRYELGLTPPKTMDPVIVAAWAYICGEDVTKLGEPIVSGILGFAEVAKRITPAVTRKVTSGVRLRSNPCLDEKPAQGIRNGELVA
jgi:hypothetical protein